MRLTLPVLFALCSLPALAQDEGLDDLPEEDGLDDFEETAGSISFDTLLVTTFQGLPPELQPEADRLYDLLVQSLDGKTELYSMADVPNFTSGIGIETDPKTYLQACPAAQYSPCALVVSERLQPDWTIGATVTEGSGGLLVDVVFLDNANQSEVLNFAMDLEQGKEDEFISGVAVIYEKVQQGAFDNLDLRDQEDAAVKAELAQAQRELIASSLAELDQELGELEISETMVIERERLTKKSLDELSEEEGRPPWELLYMSRNEYKRYANKGTSIQEWRRRRQARFGQVIARAMGTFGTGPYGQRFDTRWARDGSPTGGLAIVQFEQTQELKRSSVVGFDLELGFGVAPWFEVTGVFGGLLSNYAYSVEEENTEEPVIPQPKDTNRDIFSVRYGARVTFAPMATYTFRPTLTGGVAFWTGEPWFNLLEPPQNVPFQAMEPGSLVLAEVAPGVEVHTGHSVNLFLRSMFRFPLSGNFGDTYSEGNPGNLRFMPQHEPVGPGGPSAFGFEIQAGFLFRIGPVFTLDPSRRAGDPEDFEEDL